MSLSLPFDTLDTVVRFVCLTVDRADEEQRALLAVAFAADCHRNRATSTNRWFRVGELSDLVSLVDASRDLQPDDKRVWLTDPERLTCQFVGLRTRASDADLGGVVEPPALPRALDGDVSIRVDHAGEVGQSRRFHSSILPPGCDRKKALDGRTWDEMPERVA